MKLDKLLAYSIMAGSFLLGKNDMVAEIVYTDIVPDIILENGADISLDIDTNGTYDFYFHFDTGHYAVWGGYYDSYSFSSILNSVKKIHAGCFGDNAMVTQSVTSSSKGNIYYFAGMKPLATWEVVNVYAFNHEDISPIHIAKKQRAISVTSYTPLGDWMYSGWINPWNYNLLHGEDRYAGIKFFDENNCLHYGWIRCAVVDSNEQFIIKDFAYETFCDWAIETGKTTGGHVNINENNLLEATIYCSQSSVVIDLTQLNARTTFEILDITGKLIYEGNIETLHTQIPLINKGNYLVVIHQQGEYFVSKVVII